MVYLRQLHYRPDCYLLYILFLSLMQKFANQSRTNSTTVPNTNGLVLTNPTQIGRRIVQQPATMGARCPTVDGIITSLGFG